jgi:hypothetical protein
LERAQTTQEPVLQWLRDRNIEHQSFYIVNAILVKATREIADALAARPDVARIEGNPVIHNDLPQRGPVDQSPLQPRLPGAPATIEPGISYTHAPDVWALGFHGETIVVGSADTGVRWTHNALKPHYRGWDGANANHNFSWHDSIHSGGGVRTLRAQRSGTMAGPTKSAWRPVQSGSLAVTWTKVMARQPHTSSAWSSSWPLILLGAHRPKVTRPKRPTSRLTRGVVPSGKGAQSATKYKPLSKLKKLLVSKW